MHWVEIVGYAGSVLVAISLMMSSIIKLRWINLIGAATFSCYGLLVQAYPVFALNFFITVVDIYYLHKIYTEEDCFEIFSIDSTTEQFFQRFLDFYNDDIQKYFPHFNKESLEDPIIIFILRNMLPVGLFICEPKSEEELEIKVDYVVPDYRDLKSAHYLYYEEHDFFSDKGYKKFLIKAEVDEIKDYLEKVGFQTTSQYGENWFCRQVEK